MRHLALTLTLYMSEAGHSAFPGIERLMGRAKLARATVVAALRELVATGWLAKKKGGGRGRATEYRAIVPQTVRQAYSLRLASEAETVRSEAPNCSLAEPHHANTTVSGQKQASDHRPRNHVWDALTALFGEPTSRGRSARGRIVADLAELGRHVGLEGESLAAEVHRRHSALAADWGSRATARALVEHWVAAGSLADRRPGPDSDAYSGIDAV